MSTDSVLAQVGAEMGISSAEIEQITAETEQLWNSLPRFNDALLEELCAFPELDMKELFGGKDSLQLCQEADALLQSLGLPPPRDSRCQGKNRRGERCQMQAIEGKRVCKFHGGLSTGAKTAAGREAIRESNRRRAKKRPENLTKSNISRAEEATAEPVPVADGLTEPQRKAVDLLFNDRRNDVDIARDCGVSRRTLARWKNLPAFQSAYQVFVDGWNKRRDEHIEGGGKDSCKVHTLYTNPPQKLLNSAAFAAVTRLRPTLHAT